MLPLLPIAGKLALSTGIAMTGKKISDKLTGDEEAVRQQQEFAQLSQTAQANPYGFNQLAAPQAPLMAAGAGVGAGVNQAGAQAKDIAVEEGTSLKMRIGAIVAGAAYGFYKGQQDAEPGENKLVEGAKKAFAGGVAGNALVSANDAINAKEDNPFQTIGNGAVAGAALRYIQDEDASIAEAIQSGIIGGGSVGMADVGHDFASGRFGDRAGDMAKGAFLGLGADGVVDGKLDNGLASAGIGAGVTTALGFGADKFADFNASRNQNSGNQNESNVLQDIMNKSSNMQVDTSARDQFAKLANGFGQQDQQIQQSQQREASGPSFA